MSKIFIFKPDLEYNHKELIPSTLQDYESYLPNDTVYVLQIDGNVIYYGDTIYMKRLDSKKVSWPPNIVNMNCDHYGEVNNKTFAGSEWTIYENGYAKFDVFGSGRPIIKSLIGKLEKF